MKSKVAFDIAYGSYKNEQENKHFVREMPIKQDVVETSEMAKTYQLHPLLLPRLKKRNENCQKREKQSVTLKLLIQLQ